MAEDMVSVLKTFIQRTNLRERRRDLREIIRQRLPMPCRDLLKEIYRGPSAQGEVEK